MRALALAAALALLPQLAHAQFRYEPAGRLEGTGTGRADSRVWAPGMRFPLRDTPAFLNSQIHGVGGYMGPAGGQCDSRNYSYPWHDNYCEARRWRMPLCPAGRGHQGQDIRPATCANDAHPVVAAADGTITKTGYSINLAADDGTVYSYLHTSSQRVRVGQRVSCGDVLANVSNLSPDGRPYTTYHLHYTIKQAVRGVGSVYVPTYMSLVDSYQRLLSGDACGGAPVPQMDMGPAGAAGCYSSTLGRRVESGECVQVTRGACGSSSCGTFQCVEGRWVCPMTSCTETHENAMCSPPPPRPDPESCPSTTLGRDVDSGTCVQVGAVERPGEAPACADGCGWFRCDRGSWACVDMAMCSGETVANAECTDPGPRSCRSSVLGRDVPDGTCVQVDGRRRDGEAPECEAGCGWYRCVDGRWACTTTDECGGEQFPNGACSAVGGPCMSHTLGMEVPHGDCVQVTDGGCGRESCAWYECTDAAWSCAGSCDGTLHANETCFVGMTDPCTVPENVECGTCTQQPGCSWCPEERECRSDDAAGCDDYRPERSACEPCDFTDCASCADSGFCSWCPGAGCVNDAAPDQVAECTGELIATADGC
ncbi:MAG: M23 family metallopeptidase [Deltaproteobacteria bacterium]|nr:M23 family metallopeptidase [Deltaproteobacteria bacterium]